MTDNSMILKAANEARGYFQEKERTDGKKFWCAPDSEKSPGEWIKNMIYSAHDDGNKGPDDFVYNKIVEVLDSIIDRDGDMETAYDETEPDVYTSELTEWLNSRNDRVYYLTQALEDYGDFDDGFKLLSVAQLIEIHEIFASVQNALENRAEVLFFGGLTWKIS